MALPKRTNLHAQENLYRPLLEYRSAIVLFIAFIFMLYVGYEADGTQMAPVVKYSALLLFLLSFYRVWTTAPYFHAHWRVFKRKFLFISLNDLRSINKSDVFSNDRDFRIAQEVAHKENKSLPARMTYLCDGYEWGAEHGDRVYQIINLSSDKREIKLPFVLNPITRHFDSLARKMGGDNAIFAVDDRLPIFVTEDNWYGHTLITGNVGTGKTILLRLLSSSMLHLGHVIVVIDPKNDADWRQALELECKELGKPFFQFHPGQPSTSCAIDVCNSFVNVSDLTTRILSLIIVPGEENPFVRFAESLVSSIIAGIRLTNKKPSIKSIYKNMQSPQSLQNLAIQAMECMYAAHYGQDKWVDIVRYSSTDAFKERFKRLYEWYIAHFMNYEGSEKVHGIDVVSELIRYSTSEPEHMAKMTASLMPLFAKLTESPLDELLSPSEYPASNRDVINSEGMFTTGGVLYISLDGLSNPETAKAVSQLITSDLTACAGRRYNTGDGDMSQHSRISIFIDEAHAAINNAMISLLAQGRAAKIALFVCTQTISDFVSAADQETANRITGLCNNYISLRVNDNPTQTIIIDNFGKSSISSNQVTYTTGAETTLPHNNFTGAMAERKSTSREETIPKELLGQMPMHHIVARLQDGRKIVGQIPIAIPKNQMKRNTTLTDMIFTPVNKLTVRENINKIKIDKYIRTIQ